MTIKIEAKILSEEILVRCLLHPLWVSGGKMKFNAFLPPPERKDVSLLRLLYTDMNFCKKHAKGLKVGNSIYWGLGAFRAKHIEEVNKEDDVKINAQIICSPIDENNSYIKDISTVTTSTSGLPMHADLSYSEPIPEKGNPATEHRIYAQKLLKISSCLQDHDPESSIWNGGDFLL